MAAGLAEPSKTGKTSGQRDVFFSLGSNIDPEINLPRAVALLAQYGRIIGVSSAWESPPLGYAQQANFLNAAVWLQTDLSPRQVQNQVIPNIETALGRVRSEEKSGPRPIDIDMMLYDDQILTLDHRPIPSPEILERAFVAVPLAEIAPDFVHPQTGETLQTIARRFHPLPPGIHRREDVRLTKTPQES